MSASSSAFASASAAAASASAAFASACKAMEEDGEEEEEEKEEGEGEVVEMVEEDRALESSLFPAAAPGRVGCGESAGDMLHSSVNLSICVYVCGCVCVFMCGCKAMVIDYTR